MSTIFKKFNLQIGICALVLVFSLVPQLLLAAPGGVDAVLGGLNKSADQAGLTKVSESELPATIGTAINYLFGLLGVVFLSVVLVGGYQWLIAGGNEEKVAKAKGWIVNGINGMIVLFLAYALAYVMLQALGGAVGDPAVKK